MMIWLISHPFRLLPLFFALSTAQGVFPRNAANNTQSTCPVRTVNYITHKLPQQCLPTSNSVLTSQPGATESSPEDDLLGVVSEPQQKHEGDHLSAPTISTTSYNTTQLSPSTVLPIPEHDKELAPKPVETESVKPKDGAEEDFELESGKFMSFEEWKKQNSKAVRRNRGASQEPRKRPVQNSLESLGDEGEIDIDFSGFVPGGPQAAREVSQPIEDQASDGDDIDLSKPPRVLSRNKDAGTTCKERFNYASFDCAANVLKTNKEAKSPHTVLMENKDSYMLNKCAAPNKFLILELCNEIAIDTIVIANFEFFSSTFRTFRVGVSDAYPVGPSEWKILGTYEARNTREIQAFLVENPLIWARYVRIEFLSHYGNEFYCPVSLVRVHGRSIFEDLKPMRAEDDNKDGDRGSDDDNVAIDSSVTETTIEPLQVDPPVNEPSVVEDSIKNMLSEAASSKSLEQTEVPDASSTVPASVIAFEAIMSVIEPSDTCVPADNPLATSLHPPPSPARSARILDASTALVEPRSESSVSNFKSGNVTSTQTSAFSERAAHSEKNSIPSVSGRSTARAVSHASSEKPSISPPASDTSTDRQTSAHKSVPTADQPKSASISAQSQKERPSSSGTDRAKSAGSPSQAQPATPTMQESFFKSVQKRLQMLEANSSLSLQYIEDQSRSLRDAFKKVEQRQLTKTTAFLEQLNQTVLNELRDFRQQYDQLWQSTVIELALQRERYERDNEAINTRLGILADEVIFQRRMAILQMVLILVCLVLVLFSRGVINNYLELPLVQNVLSKSPSSKWLNLSGIESPVRPPQPVRTRSAHQLRDGILKTHRRIQSEDSMTDNQSGPEAYAPPTPISDYGPAETESSKEEPKGPSFESDKEDGKFDDPEFDPSSIERPSTSPPVLRVNGASPISDILETSEDDIAETILANMSDDMPMSEVPLNVVNGLTPIGKRLSWDLPDK